VTEIAVDSIGKLLPGLPLASRAPQRSPVAASRALPACPCLLLVAGPKIYPCSLTRPQGLRTGRRSLPAPSTALREVTWTWPPSGRHRADLSPWPWRGGAAYAPSDVLGMAGPFRRGQTQGHPHPARTRRGRAGPPPRNGQAPRRAGAPDTPMNPRPAPAISLPARATARAGLQRMSGRTPQTGAPDHASCRRSQAECSAHRDKAGRPAPAGSRPDAARISPPAGGACQ